MPAQHAGRSTRSWRRLAAAQKAKRLHCHLCGQPINYDAEPGAWDSFSADHLKPWSRHPELREDPGNIVSAHLRCNQSKSDSAHWAPGLGSLSEQF